MENQSPNLSDGVVTVMRDILDMLTREKMEILVHAAKLLPIDTPSLLSSVADLVYEKALKENRLCSTVASFCRSLSKLTVRIEESDDDGKEVLKFNRLIIDKCQWEFERNHMEDATSAMFLRHFQSASDVVTSESTADEHVISLMRELTESWQNNNNWPHQIDTQDNEMQKRLRGILNELADSNLDQIVLVIQQTPICTHEDLSSLADLVYEKAVNEHSFSSTFARLCQRLTDLSIQTELENGKTEIPFNRLIIQRCQTEFEKETKKEVKILRMAEIQACTDPNRKSELELQWVSEEIKLRQLALGNVRFIGELYNLHMLTSSVIMQIIATLMSNCEDEKLEYVCTLLTTVGKVLELQCLQENKLLDLNDCFRQLKDIANDTSSSTRVRYLIEEVLDLRGNGWFPGRNIAVVEFDLNRGQEKYVNFHERGETFINILQWILKHQDQLTGSSGRLSIDFISYIGRLANIMKTPYNPQLEWELCTTEFKGSVYMANDLMKVEESERESDEEDDEEESGNEDGESQNEDGEAQNEDGESQKEAAFNFKMGLWGHTFEHYMRGGQVT